MNERLIAMDNFDSYFDNYDDNYVYDDDSNYEVDSKECAEEEKYENLNGLKLYFKEVDNYPLLSREEEIDVALRVRAGDEEARKLLINSNLRLVISFARKYWRKGLELGELIQYGNIGLIMAVDRFDVSRGVRFSTFASYWIIQSILRNKENLGRNISLPAYFYEKRLKFMKSVNDLGKELGRLPTFEEIANYMNIPVSMVKNIYFLSRKAISLNYINNNSDKFRDKNLLDAIADDFKNVEKDAILSDMAIRVREMVDNLQNEKLIEVLKMKYGIDREYPMLQKEIAKVFNISRTQVQHLENYAISLLRDSIKIKDFSVYMDDPSLAMDRIMECRDIYRWDRNKRYCKVLKMKDSGNKS